jgi:hypothetical protein
MITTLHKSLLPLLAAAATGIAGGISSLPAHAAPFGEAELYFELNHTASDLGIHSSIDGGAYNELEIYNPKKNTMLRLSATGGLARQGLTQLFWESAEPTFDELAPATFFKRFPEGKYRIKAESNEGEKLTATVNLSHVMAAPASNITVSGVPAAVNCDAPILPVVTAPVVIEWDPVVTSHPSVGKVGPVTISRYEFFTEQGSVKFGVTLLPTTTSFEVPPEILATGGQFKFEIIARTASGNNTAIESCFILE